VIPAERRQFVWSTVFDISWTIAPCAGWVLGIGFSTVPVTVPDPWNCIVPNPLVPSCVIVAVAVTRSEKLPLVWIAATATLPTGNPVKTTTPLAFVVCEMLPQPKLNPSRKVTICPLTGFPLGSRTVNCADPSPESVMLAPVVGTVEEFTTTLVCPVRIPSCVRALIVCDWEVSTRIPGSENVPSAFESTAFRF